MEKTSVDIPHVSLLDLPNEVICQALSHIQSKKDISAVINTNKLLADLVYFSWSSISLRYDNKLSYHRFLSLPPDRLQYLQELDLSHCTNLTNALLKQILAKTPALNVIKLKNCKRITRVGWVPFVKELHRFRVIDVRGCSFPELTYALGDITGDTLLTNITDLYCHPFMLKSFTSVLDPRCVKCLKISAPEPKAFVRLDDIKNFVNLTDLSVRLPPQNSLNVPANEACVHADLSCFQFLESLKLRQSIKSLKVFAPEKIKRLSIVLADEFARSNLEEFINLESIALNNSPENYGPYQLSCSDFSILNFPKVKKLKVAKEIQLSLKELIDHKILTNLEVEWYTSGSSIFAKVIRANPSLTDLRCPKLRLNDETMAALIELNHLTRLHVGSICQGIHSSKFHQLTNLKTLCAKVKLLDFQETAAKLKLIPKLEKLILLSKKNSLYGYGIVDDTDTLPSTLFSGYPALRVLIMPDLGRWPISDINGIERKLFQIPGITYVNNS